MLSSNLSQSSDWEKLQLALQEVASSFGSIESVLEAFGLTHMPAAQRYGIFFGCVVFTGTVATVLTLLVWGGSFRRIAEQEESGQRTTLLTSTEVRKERPLLMETLLEGRDRLKANYSSDSFGSRSDESPTPLTQMLLNVAPDPPQLHDEKNPKEMATAMRKDKPKLSPKEDRYIPPHYEENFAIAYRKCQDQPGGRQLSGRPEARFEAYARAFAGCGPYTNLAYRRSYARQYEALCCSSHASDDKYGDLFWKRPCDIIGRHVRLEALSADRHLTDMFQITNGAPSLQSNSYDPLEVWGFQPEGPFATATELHQSFVFQRRRNEAGFALIHSVTDRLVGVVLLTHDNPEHLSIQLEPPIMPPNHRQNDEHVQQALEACFLILDRLFAYGYRRIQIAVDSQDPNGRKMATRLGFTHEGVLFKHMVLKDASRDSSVYGLLNSDWKRGARSALFAKLYGEAAMKVDRMNEKKEAELDEQNKQLAEQKQATDAVKKEK